MSGLAGVSVHRLPGRAAVRLGAGASVVVRPRALAVGAGALVLALAAAALALSVGDYVVPLRDVVGSLLGTADDGSRLVVLEFRLPRVVLGLLVGAAFGLAGALTSSVMRNPLATPDVLGMTTGASAAAVAALLLGWSLGVPLAAALGAGAVAVVLGAVSWRDGFSGSRLILAGIGVATASTALTSFLLVRADITEAQGAIVWLTGSLGGRGWPEVPVTAAAVLALVPVALLLGRRLGPMSLGDDLARGLGSRVARDRLLLVAVAVALAAVGTAAAGPVAFVALLAPLVTTALAGTPSPPLGASAAVGAAIVVVADLAARSVLTATGIAHAQLPVGAVTALIGGPVLLWLVARSTRTTS